MMDEGNPALLAFGAMLLWLVLSRVFTLVETHTSEHLRLPYADGARPCHATLSASETSAWISARPAPTDRATDV
jgi:hypothetical protein